MFTGKHVCELFIHENDVAKVWQKVAKTTDESLRRISVFNCGWAKAEWCWCIRYKGTDSQITEIMDWMAKEEIQTYSKDVVGY